MFFSVIVPTCRRNDLLARCLGSLGSGGQIGAILVGPDAPPSDASLAYEVIVTDDGSEMTAEAMIGERFPWVRWTSGPKRGPAANRNHGSRCARGDWVAFIDDDCVADASWLAGLAVAARERTWDVLEGRTLIPHRRDSPFLHAVENATGDCYWSCNLAVRRGFFLEANGFDEQFSIAGGEDMEFAWRIRQGHWRACFCPDALVWHPQRSYPWKAIRRSIWDRKWILLYRHKTGEAPADSAGSVRIGWAVVRAHGFALSRHLAYGWRDLRANNWKSGLFGMFWPWLILPIQLPHLLWWEFRFRREWPQKPRTVGTGSRP
jgi:GT2 family glycosyltransferase